MLTSFPHLNNPESVLMDRWGRLHTYLRISVTDRCNLRCLYCMPEEMIWKPHAEILTYEEILLIAKLLVRLGVRKIRLTGGEPLIRQDIEMLVSRLKALHPEVTVGMTTNGVRLAKQAQVLKQHGLDQLNISIDSLDATKFNQITRRNRLTEVLAGIEAAQVVGFENMKLNVVVMAGVNEAEVLDFVDFVKDTSLAVRFIEFMPFDCNQWQENKLVATNTLKARIAEQYQLVPEQGQVSDVAKTYTIQTYTGKKFSGKVGFIASMTQPFCHGCNRLRLTADGHFKACLHHADETDLRPLLRDKTLDTAETEAALARQMGVAIRQKKLEHEPPLVLAQSQNRTMVAIGG